MTPSNGRNRALQHARMKPPAPLVRGQRRRNRQGNHPTRRGRNQSDSEKEVNGFPDPGPRQSSRHTVEVWDHNARNERLLGFHHTSPGTGDQRGSTTTSPRNAKGRRRPPMYYKKTPLQNQNLQRVRQTLIRGPVMEREMNRTTGGGAAGGTTVQLHRGVHGRGQLPRRLLRLRRSTSRTMDFFLQLHLPRLHLG